MGARRCQTGQNLAMGGIQHADREAPRPHEGFRRSERWSMHHRTSRGSSDTEAKELTVIPIGDLSPENLAEVPNKRKPNAIHATNRLADTRDSLS